MSDTFDPYHEWLGIPKQEQPASAYRLLGIREFEHDGAVIANAADRTMKHLRTYQAGKRARISQKLLNEVANAKITLLDEKSKAQYDAELAVEFQASKKSLEETVTPPPQINIEPFVEDHTNAIESIAKGNQSSRGRRQRRGKKAATQSVQSRFLFVGFIAVLMIPIMVGIAFTVLKLSPPGPFANQQATKKARFIRQRKANIEAQRKANIKKPRKKSAKDDAKRKADTAFEQNLKKITKTEESAKDAAKRDAKAKRNAKEEAERKAAIETKVTYWPSGIKRIELRWDNRTGEREGLCTEWYEDGQKMEEGHYKDGERDGLWIEWHYNGQKKRQGHFKNGKQDGLWTSWHNDGQKQGEIHYKSGKKHGLRIAYDWYGQKWSEGHYKDGKEDGLRTWWDENGNKTKEIQYKDGEEVSRKEF